LTQAWPSTIINPFSSTPIDPYLYINTNFGLDWVGFCRGNHEQKIVAMAIPFIGRLRP
jgi:hypothetical protein